MNSAEAGDEVGALIKGVKRGLIKRGMVLGKQGTVEQHQKFRANVRFQYIFSIHIF